MSMSFSPTPLPVQEPAFPMKEPAFLGVSGGRVVVVVHPALAQKGACAASEQTLQAIAASRSAMCKPPPERVDNTQTLLQAIAAARLETWTPLFPGVGGAFGQEAVVPPPPSMNCSGAAFAHRMEQLMAAQLEVPLADVGAEKPRASRRAKKPSSGFPYGTQPLSRPCKNKRGRMTAYIEKLTDQLTAGAQDIEIPEWLSSNQWMRKHAWMAVREHLQTLGRPLREADFLLPSK